MAEQRKRENPVAGLVGALLGALIGVLCIVVVGQLGYVASLSGVVMAVCALKGYELLGGGLSKKGAVISGALVLVMTYFANRLDWAISAASALDMGIAQAFQSIGYLLRIGVIEGAAYWGNLVMLYLFTLLGAVPTVISGLRGSGQPAIPAPLAGGPGVGEEDLPAPQLEVYPAEKGWTKRLRASFLLPIVLLLLLSTALIAAVAAADNGPRLLLAAFGALVATFLCIFAVLPGMRLLQADGILLVRGGDGTLWRVRLTPLNANPSYRYTPKTGMWRPLTWDRLTEEERELAIVSISRAMEDIASGRVFKGNGLHFAVAPLTGLTLVKEDPWRWKVAYQVDGGEKRTSITKVYPHLRLTPDAEPAAQPLPFRWSLSAAAAALALALAAVGWWIGGGFTGQPDQPAYTVAAIPEAVETYTQNGMTYQVDSAYQEQKPNWYLDGETGAVFAVAAAYGATREDAVSRLVRPLSDYRMDETFDSFQFDRADTSSDLAQLTAQNGETYQYNILSVYFADGHAYHQGVALSESGALAVVEAFHEDRDRETAVKSALLFILESAAFDGAGAAAQTEIREDNYQSLFHLASELDYGYIAAAYIKAPEEMFGREAFVDAYLPYSPEPEYLQDGYAVQTTAHGMRVSVTIARSEETAREVVDRAYEDLVAAGAVIYEKGVTETEYWEEYDAAAKQVTFYEEDGTKARIAILYADVKQAPYYLSAQITYLPEQMDEAYPALVEELSDVFALNLPTFAPMEEQ